MGKENPSLHSDIYGVEDRARGWSWDESKPHMDLHHAGDLLTTTPPYETRVKASVLRSSATAKVNGEICRVPKAVPP